MTASMLAAAGRGARRLLLGFLLPLVGLGVVLFALDRGLTLVGMDGTVSSLLRYLVLGVYVVMAVVMSRGKGAVDPASATLPEA